MTAQRIVGHWREADAAGPADWWFSKDGKLSVSERGTTTVRTYTVIDNTHLSIDSPTSRFVYEVHWSGPDKVSLQTSANSVPGEGSYGYLLVRTAN